MTISVEASTEHDTISRPQATCSQTKANDTNEEARLEMERNIDLDVEQIEEAVGRVQEIIAKVKRLRDAGSDMRWVKEEVKEELETVWQ